VTIVLNSKSHASCAECGARWIQEGSWQRAIRSGQPRLPDDVIHLPGPVAPPRSIDVPDAGTAEEAIAT
jgi:hypothetical protein